jgi:hypothetical protein
MEIVIKKNSSRTISLPVTDIADWADCLQSAVVTFSMLDVSTGCYVVANRAANFRLGLGNEVEVDNCAVEGVTLFYELSPRQLKKKGVYRGEFRVDFLSNETQESRIYPSQENLDIIIADSITSTEKSVTTAPLPPVLLPPDNGDCCQIITEINKISFDNLVANNNLKPGMNYAVTISTGLVLVVTAVSHNAIMPFGQLITNGSESSLAIKTNIDENKLTYSVFTGGVPATLRGGSAFENDFPVEARYIYD